MQQQDLGETGAGRRRHVQAERFHHLEIAAEDRSQPLPHAARRLPFVVVIAEEPEVAARALKLGLEIERAAVRPHHVSGPALP